MAEREEGGARTVCWKATWHERIADGGFEMARVGARRADSVLVAFDDAGAPFRLDYALDWDAGWQLREARLAVTDAAGTRTLALSTDGEGRWHDGAGRALPALAGCRDIDIWPTPFTNTFALRRERFAPGERRTFTMAWIAAPELTVEPKPQAYTRLAERRWKFESLDGDGFTVELPVDADGLVLDYPGLFARVPQGST